MVNINKINSFDKYLWLFFSLIAALIVSRILYTGHYKYTFLVWNIFLAWFPYMLSNFLRKDNEKHTWFRIFNFMVCFLFLPNSFYLITDLIHLNTKGNGLWWFDSLLLFAAAFVGVMLGFVSLINIEKYLLTRFSKSSILFLMPVLFFLNAYGVYLGRFKRWNSWDIVHHPKSLFYDILYQVFNPIDNYKVWAITLLFTSLIFLMFHFLKTLSNNKLAA